MIHPTAWTVILIDWKNARADVTVTLHSGVQISGKVARVQANGPFGDELQLQSSITTPAAYDRRASFKDRLVSIDLEQIAAVEAVAAS